MKGYFERHDDLIINLMFTFGKKCTTGHTLSTVPRASGRELCYVLLIGLLLCYAMTFVLMVRFEMKLAEKTNFYMHENMTIECIQIICMRNASQSPHSEFFQSNF